MTGWMIYSALVIVAEVFWTVAGQLKPVNMHDEIIAPVIYFNMRPKHTHTKLSTPNSQT